MSMAPDDWFLQSYQSWTHREQVLTLDCLFNVLRNYFAITRNDLALRLMEVENILICLHFLTAPCPLPLPARSLHPPSPPRQLTQSNGCFSPLSPRSHRQLAPVKIDSWTEGWDSSIVLPPSALVSYYPEPQRKGQIGFVSRLKVERGGGGSTRDLHACYLSQHKAALSLGIWSTYGIIYQTSTSSVPCILLAAGFPSLQHLRFT